MSEIESQRPSGITRRRVTQGVAWAVPVIAIAAPVPAFAGASQGILTLEGTGCKLPGASNDIYKGYAFNLTATNPRTDTYYCVRIDSITLNGDTLGGTTVVNLATCQNLSSTFCIPPSPNGTLTDLAIVTELAGNSSNGQLIVGYSVKETVGCCTNEGTFAPAPNAQTGINDTPPINGASCTQFTTAQKLCLKGLSLSS